MQQQKVDLNALRALSSRLKQTDLRLEQQIGEMQRDLKALLSQVRSEYSESYVYTAVEIAEENLREVWKSGVRISDYLSKQSNHLNWSVEHYLRTENLLENLHFQTSFRPSKLIRVASVTPISRFTASEGIADTSINGYQIFASETLLQRLKQLCSRFYKGLLLRKLGEYQQGDPRILSLIQRIEKGNLTEQKDAREKLSTIVHAFEEIARSQTAYNVYTKFGNERNTLAALKNADEQRRILDDLGVSKEWYASSVDLSKQYPSMPISACQMNPLLDGSPMPIELPEMIPVFMLAMINEPYREWASANLEGLEQYALLFRESLTEIEEEQQATIGPIDPYNSVSLEDILNRNDPEVSARLKNTYWYSLSPEEQDRRYTEIKKEAVEYEKDWRDKERSARTGIGNSFMAKVFDGGTNMVVQAINTASVGLAGQVVELVMGPEPEETYDPLDNPNGKKAGEIIGNIIGFALPFKLLKTVKTPKALEKLSPTLLRSIMSEGVFSTATEVSDALSDFKNDGTQSLKERAGKVAINTVAAGAGDATIRFVAKTVFKSYQGIRQQLHELAVPKPPQGSSGKIGTIQSRETKFIPDEVTPKKGKEVGDGKVERIGEGVGSVSKQPFQIIQNRYPNEIQQGKTFEYILENSQVKIRDGIKEVDFIINVNGNLKVGRGHSHLANGVDVQAAGKLKVDANGKVRRITNESGHFTPTAEQAKNYEQIFNGAGIKTENAWLEIYQLEITSNGYVDLGKLKKVQLTKLR